MPQKPATLSGDAAHATASSTVPAPHEYKSAWWKYPHDPITSFVTGYRSGTAVNNGATFNATYNDLLAIFGVVYAMIVGPNLFRRVSGGFDFFGGKGVMQPGNRQEQREVCRSPHEARRNAGKKPNTATLIPAFHFVPCELLASCFACRQAVDIGDTRTLNFPLFLTSRPVFPPAVSAQTVCMPSKISHRSWPWMNTNQPAPGARHPRNLFPSGTRRPLGQPLQHGRQ